MIEKIWHAVKKKYIYNVEAVIGILQMLMTSICDILCLQCLRKTFHILN